MGLEQPLFLQEANQTVSSNPRALPSAVSVVAPTATAYRDADG